MSDPFCNYVKPALHPQDNTPATRCQASFTSFLQSSGPRSCAGRYVSVWQGFRRTSVIISQAQASRLMRSARNAREVRRPKPPKREPERPAQDSGQSREYTQHRPLPKHIKSRRGSLSDFTNSSDPIVYQIFMQTSQALQMTLRRLPHFSQVPTFLIDLSSVGMGLGTKPMPLMTLSHSILNGSPSGPLTMT